MRNLLDLLPVPLPQRRRNKIWRYLTLALLKTTQGLLWLVWEGKKRGPRAGVGLSGHHHDEEEGNGESLMLIIRLCLVRQVDGEKVEIVLE